MGSQEGTRYVGSVRQSVLDEINRRLTSAADRCDFTGLTGNAFSSSTAGRGRAMETEFERAREVRLGMSLCEQLTHFSLVHDVSCSAVLQFCWHETLRTYGHGNQTIVLNCDHDDNNADNKGAPNWTLVIGQHNQREGERLVGKVMDRIRGYNDGLFNKGCIEQGELVGLTTSLVDSYFECLNENQDQNIFNIFNNNIGTPFALRATLSNDGEMRIMLSYHDSRAGRGLRPGFLNAILDVMQRLLVQVVSDSRGGGASADRSIADLQLITPAQLARVESVNDTTAPFESSVRLETLFERAAAATPEAVAIVFEDGRRSSPAAPPLTLTYRALNEDANRVGHFLRGRGGVGGMAPAPEEFVALFLDLSHLTIVALLGAWKAGLATVPIDTSYPDERVAFILADTGAKLVIVSGTAHEQRLKRILGSTVVIVNLEETLVTERDRDRDHDNWRGNLNVAGLTSQQLAYVIYTSGTTGGVPKGVLKEHAGVVNNITDLGAKYGMATRCIHGNGSAKQETVALMSAYVFEPFVRQVCIALLNSHRLLIVTDDLKYNSATFPELLRKHGVTYLNGTPSVLAAYNFSCCPALARVLVCGEELSPARYARLRSTFKGPILNEYGVSECALVSTLKVFDPRTAERVDKSIGRPLRNVKTYILDTSLRLMPLGAPGELCIGGAGVARGYLNRPQLTAERFIANPFQTKAEKAAGVNAVLYKTGDLARWLPTSATSPSGGQIEIEYIGRSDTQVKLRGVRIEPAEIESVMMQHEDVAQAVVTVTTTSTTTATTTTKDDEKSLVVYYVVKENRNHGNEQDLNGRLFSQLTSKLPRYMLPSRSCLHRVDSIPVTINGKVDYASLHAGVQGKHCQSGPAGPRNAVDSKLAHIWSHLLILGCKGGLTRDIKIDIDADFVRLGGDSITGIQLGAQIRRHFAVELSVGEIFKLGSVRAISDAIAAADRKVENETKENGETHIPTPTPRPSRFLANSLQQRLVFRFWKGRGRAGSDAYTLQRLVAYSKPICPRSLENSWQMARANFAALRLRFEVDGDKVWQAIDPVEVHDLAWTFLDWTTQDEQSGSIEELLEEDRAQPFDLSHGNLFRVYLVKVKVKGQDSEDPVQRYYSVLSCHHVIIDGWSLGILYDYVHEAYSSLYSNGNRGLDPLVTCVYAEAQLCLASHAHDHLTDHFWKAQMERLEAAEGERPNLDVLCKETVRYNHQLSSYDGVKEQGEVHLVMTPHLAAGLKRFSAETGLTLASILQFGWHSLLSAYGNGGVTVVGTVVAGRHLPVAGIESAIGLFINTLPVIVEHAKNDNSELTVVEAISAIQEQVRGMLGRSNVDISKLRRGSGAHSGGNQQSEIRGRHWFDSLFVLENYPQRKRQRKTIGFEFVRDFEKLDVPLALVARDGGQGEDSVSLSLSLYYAAELFDENTMRNVLEVLIELLRQIPECSSTRRALRVVDLEFVPQSHLQQMETWNTAVATAPSCCQDDENSKAVTLDQIFERQAERWPDRDAVVYESEWCTYRSLSEMSTALALHLSACACVAGSVVALCLDKSPRMIAAILAVWKAGAGYVAMDPDYPDQRVRFILKDTKARCLVTNGAHVSWLKMLCDQGVQIVDVDTFLSNANANANAHQATEDVVGMETDSSLLAYVTYTSGTTGEPKGVLITHKTVLSFRRAFTQRLGLRLYNCDCHGNQKNDDGDRDHSNAEVICSFANYVFDFFVEPLLLGPLNGGTLLLLSDEVRSEPKRLWAALHDNRVTYLSGTPSVHALYDYTGLTHLRRLNVGGEELPPSLFVKLRSSFGGLLINSYGPTETTIISHLRLYPSVGDVRTNRSIGTGLATTRSYVLNPRTRQRLPIGALGELYIGGEGVGAGYLHRPALNAVCFLPDPFREIELGEGATRMYKTGDLVAWLPHGNGGAGELDFYGRADTQVKIRGLRIELGEIEAVLCAQPGVKAAAVVVAQAQEAKTLIGYYVTEEANETKVTESDLVLALEQRLPSYMIPSRLHALASIPVTTNGKVDYRKLAALSSSSSSTSATLSNGTSGAKFGPRNKLESHIARVWSVGLGIPLETIGIDDDFFRLGGDSITTLQLASRMVPEEFRCRRSNNNSNGLRVTVRDFFTLRTIRNLADHLNKEVMVTDPPQDGGYKLPGRNAEQGELSGGEFELLPIQEWYFNRVAMDSLGTHHRFNQVFVLRTPLLELGRLEKALGLLIKHHDALRLRFKPRSSMASKGGVGPDGYVQYYAPFSEMALTIGRTFAEIQGGFDIENGGPLIRVAYVEDKEVGLGSAQLWFVIHHLVVDTVSWRVVKEDLETIYNHGNSAPLGQKSSSYREWVTALRSQAPSQQVQSYWAQFGTQKVREELSAFHGALEQHVGIASSNHSLVRLSFELDKGATRSLLTSANAAHDTRTNDLLLTAFGIALASLTGGAVPQFITMEGHGRQGDELNDGDDLDLSRTVGWFTTLYPIRLNVGTAAGGHGRSLSENIVGVKETLARIPDHGLGYGLLFGYNKPASSPQQPLPRITFNFLGQFDDARNAKAESWVFEKVSMELDTDLSRAEASESSLLDLTVSVSNGRMAVLLKTRLNEAAANLFMSELNARLFEIAALGNDTDTDTPAAKMNGVNSDADPDFVPYFDMSEGGPPAVDDLPLIFVLPPGEGGAESYFNNIGSALPPSQFRLILFNNIYLHNNRMKDCAQATPTPTPFTFESLAAYYLTFIRKLQPAPANGDRAPTYNFIGWSFGGVLALEICRQLNAECNAKLNLFIIDSYFDASAALAGLGIFEPREAREAIADIYLKYTKTKTDFEALATQFGALILFKAMQLNEGDSLIGAQAERRLFEFYCESEFNSLDSLLPAEVIQVVTLDGDSHFSWPTNPQQVQRIADRIAKAVIKEQAIG